MFRTLASGRTVCGCRRAPPEVKVIGTYRARVLEKMGLQTNAEPPSTPCETGSSRVRRRGDRAALLNSSPYGTDFCILAEIYARISGPPMAGQSRSPYYYGHGCAPIPGAWAATIAGVPAYGRVGGLSGWDFRRFTASSRVAS
jgi:hypothetical protein